MKLGLLRKWADFAVAVFVWGTVEWVLVVMVPVFAYLYDQYGGVLPGPTCFVIKVAPFLRSVVIPVMLVGLVVFQGWRIRRLPSAFPDAQGIPWDNKSVLAFVLVGAVVFILVTVALYLP